MRKLIVIVLVLGAAGWLVYAYTGEPAPMPDDLEQLDPLIADAVRAASTAVNSHRRDREARFKLAMVYHANGMRDLALQCYEHLSSRSADPRVWYGIALLWEERGDVQNAIDAMQRSIEIDDTHAAAHWRLGYWLMDNGQLDEAEGAFDRAIELSHSSYPAWFGLARVQLQQGELDEAIDLIERRLLGSQESAYARHLLTNAYRRAGRMDDADRESRLASSASPKWSDPWSEMIYQHRTGYQAMRHHGEFLMSRGRYGEAISLLEEVRREVGEDPPLLNMLGVAYFTDGRTELGLQTLHRALELDPRSYPTLLNLARVQFRAAGPTASSDNLSLELALADARRAAEIHPESGDVYTLIGAILHRRGDLNGAIDALKQAFENDSRNLATLLDAGMLELQLHRWQDAAESFSRIIALDEHMADAHLGYGHAMLELGAVDQARVSLERARQLGVSMTGRLNALRRRLEDLAETTTNESPQHN